MSLSNLNLPQFVDHMAREVDDSQLNPLLEHGKGSSTPGISLDWMGRPAEDRHDLGGWTCSFCAIGAFGLVYSAFYGIAANLVLYLVDEWEDTNAVAANTVTNLVGTTFLSSFIGGFASDGYMGRLWGSIIFEAIALLSCLSITLAALFTTSSQSQNPSTTALLFSSLYIMALGVGGSLPNLTALGADQLQDSKDKAIYFTLVAMAISAGQILATTVVAYLDGKGLWVVGFWVCTAAAGGGVIASGAIARKCRQQQAGGNPVVRVIQVLVAACRKHNIALPSDPAMLYEVTGELSVIPGSSKLSHTNSLRCLDKAAVLIISQDYSDPTKIKYISPWKLCTITQVEEVKCLFRLIPMGLASMFMAATFTQTSTLFEEQASLTNRRLAGITITPASMNLFCIGGAILMGTFYNSGGARLLGKCFHRSVGRPPTSLQLQGLAMFVDIVAMAVAAIVEAMRLHAIHTQVLISIAYLIPQYFLIGVSINLNYSGSLDFFYNEVSDGMRATSTSINLLFIAFGNYLSSILILLMTMITTQGGQQGWIPKDLNNGHVDYFYWFLTSLLACSFGVYLVYAHFYTYRVSSSSMEA